jgi:hypothetical protein
MVSVIFLHIPILIPANNNSFQIAWGKAAYDPYAALNKQVYSLKLL